MILRKTGSLTITLLLLIVITHAQVSMNVRVIDSKTLQGITGATVSLYKDADSSLIGRQFSDSTGNANFQGLMNGRYRLGISSTGYLPLFSTIMVAGLENITDSFFVEPDPKLLGGVIITSERPAFQRKGDRLIMPVSGNQFFKTAANATDIIRKIPGLSVGGDGALLVDGRITPGVFINGRPVPMSAEELLQYLNSLNPEMISSIELISNPSSRYDGEYKAIIDIKLKRDLALGWKGSLTMNLQQNAYSFSENNLLLTYKTRRIAYTLRGGYTTGTRIYRYRARQILSDNNILSTRTATPTHNSNINYQAGADYTISKKQRVEISLRHYIVNRDAHSVNTLLSTDPSGTQTVLHTTAANNSSPKQNNYGANLNYTALLRKTDLQLQGTWLRVANHQDEDIRNSNKLNGQLLSHWQTALKNDITIRAIQLDLSKDALKGKFSAGSKFAYTTTRNDLRYDTLNDDRQFIRDSSRTNNFSYDEYISAAYIGYEGNKNNLSYTASLRAEHTGSIANSITTHQVTRRNYLNLLPAFSITYSKNNRQYHLSYSRKLTRPNFAQLNPFRFYLSPLNYVVGNPLLLPSKTSSFNLAYSYKTFSARVAAGKETDPLARYPEYNDTTHVLEYLGRNLPYNHFLNLEGSYAFQVTKWWRLSHTLGILYKKELTPYHDKTFSIGIWDYTVNGSQIFNLPGGFNADITYKYQSPGGNGLYNTKSYFYIDLGLQKTWLGGKLNTRFNYYDIFNGFEVQYIFRDKQIINNELAHWFGTNRVSATIIYSFGNSTYKIRQGNRAEEEGRSGMQ